MQCNSYRCVNYRRTVYPPQSRRTLANVNRSMMPLIHCAMLPVRPVLSRKKWMLRNGVLLRCGVSEEQCTTHRAQFPKQATRSVVRNKRTLLSVLQLLRHIATLRTKPSANTTKHAQPKSGQGKQNSPRQVRTMQYEGRSKLRQDRVKGVPHEAASR